MSTLDLTRQRLKIKPEKYQEAGELIIRFLDLAGTATGRATYYDSKEDQLKAERLLHQEVFNLDRGIYGVCLALPGLMDRARQTGTRNLLTARNEQAFLTLEEETNLIWEMVQALPIQRQLKLFGTLKGKRINNTRTRKLILRTIFGWDNFEWKSVKYRRKIQGALTHAWGIKLTSIIKTILNKSTRRTPKDLRILEQYIQAHTNRKAECVSFILGNELAWEVPILKAYEAARHNFKAGRDLPPEVMEGLRSTYHTKRSASDVLELTAKKHTIKQAVRVQKRAKTAKIEVEFDPLKLDAVSLYIHAYETGLTVEIKRALIKKAKAAVLPIDFGQVGIVLDTSASMFGHDTQKHRPISIALAMANTLASGMIGQQIYLPTPEGETNLATDLIEILKTKPDNIFIISDGYENAPAGRIAEIIGQVQKMGINTPIYQLSPIMDAANFQARPLSPNLAVFPINQQLNFGAGLIKQLLRNDFERGLAALVSSTEIPLLLEVTS